MEVALRPQALGIATIGEDGVVAYEAQAHCPRSEGLGLKGARVSEHVKKLMN